MKPVVVLHRTTGKNPVYNQDFFLYLGIGEPLFNVEVDSPSATKIDIIHVNSEKAEVWSCRGTTLNAISSFSRQSCRVFSLHGNAIKDNETANS